MISAVLYNSCTGSCERYARELGQALQLRYTPELTFVADDSIAEGAHILELIEKLDK